MITSAEEFIRLRSSHEPAEYRQAAHDTAALAVWQDVIRSYPDYKTWIVHNKSVPLIILQILAQDPSVEVRCSVARKRKIMKTEIFDLFVDDANETVRAALINNTNMDLASLLKITPTGSGWYQAVYQARLVKLQTAD